MSYVEYLQKSIDYIEENIKQPITIEACAEVAGFSKYHFYRLFTLFAGVPLMEYVRKRRLAYAMQDVNRGRRILDIALDYEYGSERAFRRAFQNEYGEAPARFRNKHYAIPEKPILKENKSIICGGINMEYHFSDVRIEKLDTMYVTSSYAISDDPEADVINFMTEWMVNNNIDIKSRQFGFDIPVSEEQSQKGLRGYEYWIKVEDNTNQSEGVILKTIEECEYAILRITNPFSNPFEVIPAGWSRLAEWVRLNDYMPDCKSKGNKEKYWLEEKVEENGVTYMDLYFPLN
ncbi:AraC family transcriptional regulator [Anaeromicropila herbilytica]|uniref:AraC family transcriptional regulator n=1 Tax=Anaeromicropila herbilytica TaxID=2785025 RepID=A0A7R7IED7_9FIRM|nr:AraC family transcriptional regulator [Anaeromicropila herbilytica]BCN31881.1 AraC family transcriptional regulator [Anaeromicropila herbilytica]